MWQQVNSQRAGPGGLPHILGQPQPFHILALKKTKLNNIKCILDEFSLTSLKHPVFPCLSLVFMNKQKTPSDLSESLHFHVLQQAQDLIIGGDWPIVRGFVTTNAQELPSNPAQRGFHLPD